MPDDRRQIPPRQPSERHEERLSGRDLRRDSVPPLTQYESEELWKLLQKIDAGQRQIQTDIDLSRGKDLQWRSDVNERLDQHERDIHELKKTTLAVGELKLEQQKSNELLTRIDVHNREQDADLKAERSRVDALISEKKAEASAKRSKLWTALTVAAGIATTILNHCGPAIIKALNQ